MSEKQSVVTLDHARVQLGDRIIWDDATCALAQGEFIAIVGPNGAGKSTLLRVLLGLQPLQSGSVTVLGIPPRRGNPKIGYVPQHRSIPPDLQIRGRDLVGLGLDGHRWGFGLPGRQAREKEAHITRALQRVSALAYADRPLHAMSGGEQQRLLLAQAVLTQPSLLLLDEPLANLDIRNQREIVQLVAEIVRTEQTTALLVTHDVNPLLPYVDRILYIAHGHVLLGTPEEVITTETLSRLYNAPVEVLRDSTGQLFVVGLENEIAHSHEHEHAI